MRNRYTQTFLFSFSVLFSSSLATAAAKLTISCGSNGVERQICQSGIDAWSKKTGVPVAVFSSPNDSNDRLALYQQLLGAGSSDIDVYQIDVVWPGLLANQMLDLKTHFTPAELKAHIPGALANNQVGEKLVAIPWFTDGGVLYYRSDLLKKYGKKVPATWQELEATAKDILEKEKAAGNADLWGYVYQGRAYEGLTCNALEWIASFGGGQLFDASGKATFNNPQAVAALDWIGAQTGTIVPRGALSYSEEEARGTFQSGKAIFLRNWPYVWGLVQSDDSLVKGKVGMAALPTGKAGAPRASTLGGWSLAVSAYSKFPKEAADLVRYLTSAEEQKRRSIEGAFNPTRVALYDDAAILKKNPHLKELKPVFLSAVPRPAAQTGAKYNRFSADFWNAVHSVLSQNEKAAAALKKLEERVATYTQGGKG
ncbi:ABC transporter substrate-binding protein [bacterium]|nr:ABC transporter substrate-binding protein [bacterium]